MTLDGIGSRTATTPYAVAVGVPRPDHGDGYYVLACDRCGATWVGPEGEPCWWCQRALELMRETQGRRVLQPPEVDPDDALYARRMRGWQRRLWRAVEAGIATQGAAQGAWRRAVQKGAA